MVKQKLTKCRGKSNQHHRLDGSLLDEFGAKKLAEALKQNTSLRNLR